MKNKKCKRESNLLSGQRLFFLSFVLFFILKDFMFFYSIIHRYDDFDIALNCGLMLRESIRHEPLAKVVLHSEHFYRFFKYVEMSTFDIASDAFSTFKVRKSY